MENVPFTYTPLGYENTVLKLLHTDIYFLADWLFLLVF